MSTTDNIIAADTHMGAVSLKVKDLDAMTRYYHEGIGLDVLSQQGARVELGSAGTPLVVLEHSPLLTHAPASAAGLFHTALLYDTQADLSRVLYSIASKFPGSFTGSSDHLVSEALYFDDPEGNGVELYWDRPRTEWQIDGSHIAMDTIFLDPNKFLRDHLTEEGSQSPVAAGSVGHVHLKVGDIRTAREFYADTVGFEVTNEYGTQALFVSAGGYHHHLGMNTWQSRGALDRSPALGLGEVAISVPTADDLAALQSRLNDRRIAQAFDGQTLTFEDPWKNEISVSVAA